MQSCNQTNQAIRHQVTEIWHEEVIDCPFKLNLEQPRYLANLHNQAGGRNQSFTKPCHAPKSPVVHRKSSDFQTKNPRKRMTKLLQGCFNYWPDISLILDTFFSKKSLRMWKEVTADWGGSIEERKKKYTQELVTFSDSIRKQFCAFSHI